MPGPLAQRHALVREALLAEGGNLVLVAARCWSCGGVSDLEFDLGAVTLPEARSRVELRRDGGVLAVRLPSAADLDAAATPEDLVRRCVGGEVEHLDAWLEAAEEAWSAADPLGDIRLQGACFHCRTPLEASYDLAGAWLERVEQRMLDLLEELHVIASHYGWREDEILRLPELRRRAYVGLCLSASPMVAEPSWV